MNESLRELAYSVDAICREEEETAALAIVEATPPAASGEENEWRGKKSLDAVVIVNGFDADDEMEGGNPNGLLLLLMLLLLLWLLRLMVGLAGLERSRTSSTTKDSGIQVGAGGGSLNKDVGGGGKKNEFPPNKVVRGGGGCCCCCCCCGASGRGRPSDGNALPSPHSIFGGGGASKGRKMSL